MWLVLKDKEINKKSKQFTISMDTLKCVANARTHARTLACKYACTHTHRKRWPSWAVVTAKKIKDILEQTGLYILIFHPVLKHSSYYQLYLLSNIITIKITESVYKTSRSGKLFLQFYKLRNVCFIAGITCKIRKSDNQFETFQRQNLKGKKMLRLAVLSQNFKTCGLSEKKNSAKCSVVRSLFVLTQMRYFCLFLLVVKWINFYLLHSKSIW